MCVPNKVKGESSDVNIQISFVCYRGVDWEDKKEGGEKGASCWGAERTRKEIRTHNYRRSLDWKSRQRRGGTSESAGPERELKENWAQGKKWRFGIFSSKKNLPSGPSDLTTDRLFAPSETTRWRADSGKKHQTRTKTLNYTRTQGWRLRVNGHA